MLRRLYSRISCISIHSLARRLTFASSAIFSLTSHFNSQPRKEADEQLDVAFRSEEDFNSQPRKEADLIQIVVISGLIKFQFTASQGG